MVFPLGHSSPPLVQDYPPEVICRLKALKWCVWLMYVSASGRAFAGDLLGYITDLWAAFLGTYLLSEDPDFKQCYECLHSTPLATCGQGGLHCLLPSIFYFTMNGTSALVRMLALATESDKLKCRFPVVFTCMLPYWMLASAIIQLVALCLCWQVYRLLREDILNAVLLDGFYDTMLPLDQQPLNGEMDRPLHPLASVDEAEHSPSVNIEAAAHNSGRVARPQQMRLMSSHHWREHRPVPAFTPFSGPSFQLPA
mmetsp:Transcript_38200/g.89640  ORF Transcript_38200/g.89640 Transcript_38200/m.89640 type:complete len:254 (-) Transcript_38200:14-775(-)